LQKWSENILEVCYNDSIESLSKWWCADCQCTNTDGIFQRTVYAKYLKNQLPIAAKKEQSICKYWGPVNVLKKEEE